MLARLLLIYVLATAACDAPVSGPEVPPESAAASVMAVPEAPTGTTAEVRSRTVILVRWNDHSTIETHFEMERQTQTSGDWGTWTLIATVPTGSTEESFIEYYRDRNVTYVTPYRYRVRACNADGCSPYGQESDVIELPPPAPVRPASLTAAATAARLVQLTWPDVLYEERYELERQHATGGLWSAWTAVAITDANATVATDTVPWAGASYNYRLRSCNTTACSAYITSNTVTTPGDGTPPPVAPLNPAASVINGSTVDVTWQDGSNSETAFQLRRRLKAPGSSTSFGSFVIIAVVGEDTTHYRDGGLSPGYTAQYAIRACHPGGCSIWVNTGFVTTPQPPAVPAFIEVAAASETAINVIWDDVSDETSYELDRRLYTSGLWSDWGAVTATPANDTTHADVGLLPGRTYQYRVRACNAAACSAYVTSAEVSTLPPPAGPMNIVTTVIAGTRIDLSWTDASTNETYFKLQRRVRSGDGSWPAYEGLATLPTNANSYADNAVLPGRTYQYRIRACNAAACSPWQEGAQVTTPDTPLPPDSLVAVAVSGSVELSWNDRSSNETFFTVGRRQFTSGNWSGWQNVGGPAANATFFSDSTVSAGSVYQYRVRACNGNGCSLFVVSGTVSTP